MLTAQVHALDVRRRLRNPPGGRSSDEMEIVSDSSRRRQAAEAARAAIALKTKQEAEARRVRLADLVDGFVEAHRRTGHEFLPSLLGRVSVEKIVVVVCAYYRKAREHVLSYQRTPDLVKPRHVIMWLSRELTIRTRGEIGKCIGDRDSTTVLNGQRKIARLLAAGDPHLTQEIAEIKKLLGVEG
jgi:chromosomal replication initiation ATPase DnaA